MGLFPIGVMLDSFRVSTLQQALEKAQRAGVSGVQMHTNRGEVTPELNAQQRRDVSKRIKDLGLTLSATCGEQSLGFVNEEKNPELIERSKRMLDLALDLGTNIVTTHIGVVPEDAACSRYQIMQSACFEMAQYADSVGAHFAIETGPEPAIILKGFLDALGSTGVAVNLDPANLVMVTGDDPVQAVYTLRSYIVHTHAKDGSRLKEGDVEFLYKTAAAEQYHGSYLLETPLGEGSVDYPRYLNALTEVGYHGYLTIERECGEQPELDICNAVHYLHGLMQA